MKQMNEHLSYLIEVNGKKMIAKKVANKKSMHTYMDNDKKLQLLLAKKENNGTPTPIIFLDKLISIREREEKALDLKIEKFKSRVDSGSFLVEVENKKEYIKKLNKEIINLRKNSSKYSQVTLLSQYFNRHLYRIWTNTVKSRPLSNTTVL